MHFLRHPFSEPHDRTPVTRWRVLGVGSPHGDDAVGWLAVEAFQSARPRLIEHQIETRILDRPGAGLLHYLVGADAVIIVDAVQGGDAPGTVDVYSAEQFCTGGSLLAVHGFGLASTLALGRVLDMLPPRLTVVGVHIAQTVPGAPMTPAVRESVAKAAAKIRAMIGDPPTRAEA